jgi:hypothetical protein
MEETFTEHQVRVALGLLGWSEGAIEDALREMRMAPPRPGVGGFSDDELKGTARDEAHS